MKRKLWLDCLLWCEDGRHFYFVVSVDDEAYVVKMDLGWKIVDVKKIPSWESAENYVKKKYGGVKCFWCD